MKRIKVLIFLCFLGANIYSLDLVGVEITGIWRSDYPGGTGFDMLVIHENMDFFLYMGIGEQKNTDMIWGVLAPRGNGTYFANVFYETKKQSGVILFDQQDGKLRLSFYEDNDFRYVRIYKREGAPTVSPELSNRSAGSGESPSGNNEVSPDNETEPEEWESPRFYASFGTVGMDSYFSANDTAEVGISVNIYSLKYRSYIHGFGMELIPAKYTYGFFNKQHSFSFLAVSMFWNFFDFTMDQKPSDTFYFLLGPVFTLECLNFVNFKPYSIENLIFNAGFRLEITMEDYVTLFRMEAGYRRYSGRDNFYLTISTDNILPLIVSAWPFLTW